MEEITLNAQPRSLTGKRVRQLRRSGVVPGVVYGHRTEPMSVQIQERELRHVLQHTGGTQLIKLEVGDGGEPRMVLLREVQREPIKRGLLHVDLYEVVMTERVRASIPIVLTGTSPVVKRGDGLMHHGLEAIEVECLPGDLIPHIEVDLSGLEEIDQGITVGDLKLGDKFEVLSDPNEIVARVIPARAEEVIEEPTAAPAAEAEVEVVKREKPEEAAEEEKKEE